MIQHNKDMMMKNTYGLCSTSKMSDYPEPQRLHKGFVKLFILFSNLYILNDLKVGVISRGGSKRDKERKISFPSRCLLAP